MLSYKRSLVWIVPVAILALFLLEACGGSIGDSPSSSSSSPKVINVVAAENFYGNVVSQLGESHVAVTSILSDPSVDPHEYSSNAQTALKVSKADLVIENSAGYDGWMDKLLSASPNSNRVVLKGFDLAPKKLQDNPHVWYSIENMESIAQGITDALKKLDSTDASTFDNNLTKFKQSLDPIQQQIRDIKGKYNGTPVALTETIYLYQTEPEGLDVLTPFAFEKAIAEGNDPPADTVAKTNDSISKKEVKVLIYNVQTVTPITTNLQNNARKLNIPIVPVSETMPSGKTYQIWMTDQLTTLASALQQATGK